MGPRGWPCTGTWAILVFAWARTDHAALQAEMATHYWYIDSSKAQSELGFKPRDPRETLLDTINWIRENSLVSTPSPLQAKLWILEFVFTSYNIKNEKLTKQHTGGLTRQRNHHGHGSWVCHGREPSQHELTRRILPWDHVEWELSIPCISQP